MLLVWRRPTRQYECNAYAGLIEDLYQSKGVLRSVSENKHFINVAKLLYDPGHLSPANVDA